MSTTLPEPIATYFRMKNGDAPDAVSACFSPDATVFDKGEDLELEGRKAIGRWMTRTSAQYKTETRATGLVTDGDETVVTALVSGDFPGSPAEFDYRFASRDGRILRLVIEFKGFR